MRYASAVALWLLSSSACHSSPVVPTSVPEETAQQSPERATDLDAPVPPTSPTSNPGCHEEGSRGWLSDPRVPPDYVPSVETEQVMMQRARKEFMQCVATFRNHPEIVAGLAEVAGLWQELVVIDYCKLPRERPTPEQCLRYRTDNSEAIVTVSGGGLDERVHNYHGCADRNLKAFRQLQRRMDDVAGSEQLIGGPFPFPPKRLAD